MFEQIDINLIYDLKGLNLFSDKWDRLAMEVSPKFPMLSYAWISSYLETMLQPEEKWVCVFAFQRQELVGVLPLIIRKEFVVGVPVSILATPFNSHSRFCDVLIKPGFEEIVLTAILYEIKEKIRPEILIVKMHTVVEGSPTISSSISGNYYRKVFSKPIGCGSYLPVEGSFEEFYAQLGANFRGNLRKAKNKLYNLNDVEFKFIESDQCVPEHLHVFMNLEASGWKGEKGTAIQFSPKLVSFYTVLTRRLVERNWLEWHFLSTSNNIIAGQMAVRMGKTLVLLKIAYDERFHSVAPGNMLFLKTTERAYSLKYIDEINCLTDMPWHDKWKMKKRIYYYVNIFPDRMLTSILCYFPSKIKCILRELPIGKYIVNSARRYFKINPEQKII